MQKTHDCYEPSLQASYPDEALSITNVYVKSLLENCTDNDLEEMCKQ